MTELQTSEEIGKYYNFLFWDENGKDCPAQIWVNVWQDKTTPDHSGRTMWLIPPCMTTLLNLVPINSTHTSKPVDIDICFMVDEPLFFRVKGLKLLPQSPKLDELFKLALAQKGGEVKDPESIEGYVKSKTSNQTEFTIYKVLKSNGNFYNVHKMNKKGTAISWELMSTESPRIKSIINQFESELTNGSLQTDLSKMM